MRAFLLLLALAASAVAQHNIGMTPWAGLKEAGVPIGTLQWMGRRYVDATATVASDGKTINVLAKDGATVVVPWEKAPFDIRNRLAAARAAAGQQANASDFVKGQIVRRTYTGFLIEDLDTRLIVHVVGKSQLADGEMFRAQLQRSGLYYYITPDGVKSTVKQYLAPPSQPQGN